MVQKAAELVVQRREEMAQSLFGGLPDEQLDDQPEEQASQDDEQAEDDSQETFSDDDIEEFLDQNLDDLLQDLDNIEAENDQEDSQ